MENIPKPETTPKKEREIMNKKATIFFPISSLFLLIKNFKAKSTY